MGGGLDFWGPGKGMGELRRKWVNGGRGSMGWGEVRNDNR